MEEPEYLHGIFIYKLPVTRKQAAITHLQKKTELSGAITSVIDDKLGLKVFFNDYAPVWLIVIERFVTIENSSYAVYPTVTNLTVHGIRPFLPNTDAFRNHIQDWGPIINIYPVSNKLDESQWFETDDLRVILNVPEVPELLNLPSSVKISSFDFEVSHFCRLCRREGHTQFHCTFLPERSSVNTEAYHQSKSSDGEIPGGNQGAYQEAKSSDAEIPGGNQGAYQQSSSDAEIPGGNQGAYQQSTSSDGEIPRGIQGASEGNTAFCDETVYGCFSPTKTPSSYHLNHHQNQSFEQIPFRPFVKKITPDSCTLTKIQSDPNFWNSSCYKDTSRTYAENSTHNSANSSYIRKDCLREIIRTAKENEQFSWRNDLQGASLKSTVKHEQIFPESDCLDKDTLRKIIATAKHTEEHALHARFDETKQQCHSAKHVKQELLESPYYSQLSTEENLIHKAGKYEKYVRRVESTETISSDRCSYGFARRGESYSESHISSRNNRHDSKAMIHKNWRTSSQENVSAVANHSTFMNKSERINEKFSASTSFIDRNRYSITHEYTNYSDDRFKRNSAELRKKTFLEKSSPTFQKECSKRSIGKISENISSVKSRPAVSPKCSTGNVSKDISSSTSNASTASKCSIGKDAKNISSNTSNSSASSATTKCQNASTSSLKPTINKKRLFGSRKSSDRAAPVKSKVLLKRKKEIRFNMLLPGDCNISEEYIRSFCREASKSPEAFRTFIRNGSCLLHSEIQKILAFNYGKSRNLNLSEKKFLDCLEKMWIKLNHHVKYGTAPADALFESDLINPHSEPREDKTSKSFSSSRDDEPQQDKALKRFSCSEDDGNLSIQKDSGKKRPRLSKPSKSNPLSETEEENTKKLSMVISPGLKNAIKKSKGVLTPDEMECFLIQVYKRVHPVKISRCFNTDTSAICRQLDAVKDSYYRSGSRTTKGDLNMRIVRSLRKRMLEHATCKNCLKD